MAEVLAEDESGEIWIVVRVVWRSIRRVGVRSGQQQSRNALRLPDTVALDQNVRLHLLGLDAFTIRADAVQDDGLFVWPPIMAHPSIQSALQVGRSGTPSCLRRCAHPTPFQLAPSWLARIVAGQPDDQPPLGECSDRRRPSTDHPESIGESLRQW